MIKKMLTESDRVIDIGCGNGYTTRLIAPFVSEAVGIDYSVEMINRAMATAVASQEDLRKPPVTFRICDVLDLTPSTFGLFDLAISERCLINLASWDEQKRAIANIASILKPRGSFIFVEGSRQGRARLNELRESVGLQAMPPVWHNIDFDESLLLEYLGQSFDLEQRLHFGVYDFISRLVHPLIVAPELPKYDSRINEVAARLSLHSQEFTDISRVLFLVLRKKSSESP